TIPDQANPWNRRVSNHAARISGICSLGPNTRSRRRQKPPTNRRNTSQRKPKKCSNVIARSPTIDPARACVRRQNGARLVLARRGLGQTSLADGQGRINLPFRCEDCLGSAFFRQPACCLLVTTAN